MSLASFSIITILILGFIYWIPGIVASARGHHNSLAINVMNLFLGWTMIFWILALIWACTAVKSETANTDVAV